MSDDDPIGPELHSDPSVAVWGLEEHIKPVNHNCDYFRDTD